MDNKFFAEKLDLIEAERLVKNTLKNSDDGELFLEYSISEAMTFDEGYLKNTNFDISQGFGLRAVKNESSSYAYSSDISIPSLRQASENVQALSKYCKIGAEKSDIEINRTQELLYSPENPLNGYDFKYKLELLKRIDDYIRSTTNLAKQVTVSLAGEWQVIWVIRPDGKQIGDIRPLVRLSISVVLEKNGRREVGSASGGGRENYDKLLAETYWKQQADEAMRQAMVNLESISAPAGEMPVLLGPGWPAVLLHEAVGHGLEADFNRKKSSAFTGMIGKRVAAPGVTVIDDGTIHNRRGSLSIDDEGTPTSKNILIEDGILQNYIYDRLNARLMGSASTGNGRRESFEYQPMPRMTNTYMLAGNDEPDSILNSMKKGIYAVNFSGGQVDITSGKFVFSTSEAYLVENGKITTPLKGVSLIGNGPDALTKIVAVGNDMQLDPGVGTCGKNGQSVAVGVGQPTMLLSAMTVGGTEL